MTNKCKLFLISSVTYKGNTGGVDSYIEVMRSFLSRYPDIQEPGKYKHLSDSEVFYSESETTPDVNDISSEVAINMAREFSMCLDTDFAQTFIPEKKAGSIFHIENCKADLLYDSHAFFTIIYEVTINYDSNYSENTIILEIFKKREIFKNLGITLNVENCKDLAISKIKTILEGINLNINPDSIQFEDDNTLPFILFPVGFEVDQNQFRNEEVSSSIGEKSRLSTDYENAFFHPGWNYTVASGFPREVFINLIQMTIKAQSFFFSLGYMKSYYTRELNKTLKERDSIAEFHVDTAEDVQLAFYDLLAKFYSFKNKLFPKYHLEFCALMDRWHCDEDIENIKSYIELDLQSKNRIHSSRVEKQNDRQNKALTFIALVQLISIYGAFADGNAIFSESKMLFLAGTFAWTISLFAYLMVSKYFKWAILYLAVTSLSLFWIFRNFNLFS